MKSMRTKPQALTTKPLSALLTRLHRTCETHKGRGRAPTQAVVVLVAVEALCLGLCHAAFADDFRITNNEQIAMRFFEGSFGALTGLLLGLAGLVCAALRRWKTALASLVLAGAIFVWRYEMNWYFNIQSLQLDDYDSNVR